MSYHPHRTSAFEYVTDLLDFIEERQCCRCPFRGEDANYPMCPTLMGEAIGSDPVASWDEVSPDVVVCRQGPAPVDPA